MNVIAKPKLVDARQPFGEAALIGCASEVNELIRRRNPPGCIELRDKRGNVRIYYRPKKTDPKIRLRGVPWTPEFMAQYEAARNGSPIDVARAINPGTFRWLTTRYFRECADFIRLDQRTKHVRRLIIEEVCREPIREGSSKHVADMPLSEFSSDSVEVLRDRKIHTPESANSRLKALRQVFKWAAKKKIARHDPTQGVDYFKTGSLGWHTWTVEEVRQFEAAHPIGTKARLFFALLLFLGVRRSDAIRLGKQHRRGSSVTFLVHKGRNKKPKRLTLPILPPLKAVLDASPLGEMTWLVTDKGQPFSDAGIGNKMRNWCDEAGLPHCAAHGVRKAGATILAEKGATAHQLMAIFGWDKLEHAEGYTRTANQKRLAESAMGPLADWDSPSSPVSPLAEKA